MKTVSPQRYPRLTGRRCESFQVKSRLSGIFYPRRVFLIIKAEVISVKTSFYSISGYAILNKVPVPSCFVELDEYFDKQFTSLPGALRHPFVRLAYNLCRRMADIDTYAQDVSDVLNEPAVKYGEIRISTFLVGYFSACKAIFDAAAISLATLYFLTFTDKNVERSLSNKQMDFSKREFWNALEKDIRVKNRFIRFKPISDEVVSWRDAAVHRVAPFVIQRRSNTANMEIKMAAKPDADMSYWMNSRDDKDWLDPLDLHRKWRPLFLELCQEICHDISSLPLSSTTVLNSP